LGTASSQVAVEHHTVLIENHCPLEKSFEVRDMEAMEGKLESGAVARRQMMTCVLVWVLLPMKQHRRPGD
jgi:hypothetical protein